MKLVHGGNLIQASAEFGIPLQEWLDLSTGISPWSWPVPPVPAAVWRRLPEEEDDLQRRASAYYGAAAESLLPVPGSQYGIRQLPTLWQPDTVALPLWGYREHHRAWTLAGYEPVLYRDAAHLRQLADQGVVRYGVVINPCNPTTEMFAPELLQRVAADLARHGGHLIVDEAFMDPYPESSVIPSRPANVVVLRSIGKFFGLAGIRLGFVCASYEVIARLRQEMDPWAVSHTARWVGSRALADHGWQARQTRRLEKASHRWQQTLNDLFPSWWWQRTAHFVSAEMEKREAEALFRVAARSGLLIRRLESSTSRGMVRLGLPDALHWSQAVDRLIQARERLS